jgi:hypothetical protein
LAADSVLNRLLGGLGLVLGAPALGPGGLVVALGGLGAAAGGLVAAACARAGPAAAKNRNREITSFPIADLQGVRSIYVAERAERPGNDAIGRN